MPNTRACVTTMQVLNFFASVLLDAMDAMFLLYAVDRDHRTMMPRGQGMCSSRLVARAPFHSHTLAPFRELPGFIHRECCYRAASMFLSCARAPPLSLSLTLPLAAELHDFLSQQQVGRPISGVKYTPRGWTFVQSGVVYGQGLGFRV